MFFFIATRTDKVPYIIYRSIDRALFLVLFIENSNPTTSNLVEGSTVGGGAV